MTTNAASNDLSNNSPTSSEQAAQAAPSVPVALLSVKPPLSRWFASRFWIMTVLCGMLSAGLFWYSKRSTGDLITIAFQQGHGLKPEDRLAYRGIDIGAVEKIELHTNRDSVVVHVRLSPDARTLAAEGAKFWIVRPLVSLDSIQGLDTLIGAKYIAIEPPQMGTRLQSHFIGLDSPPIVAPPEGALEISLDGNTRGGLENGAPILFRGFRIGNVIQIGLASDARTVRARCAIDPEYRDLVRKNSKFWNRSGWSLEIGITGIKLDADTFSQIVSGGIEMATPTEPAAGVSTGHRFVLYDKPEADWLSWKPSLAHGKVWSSIESRMPQPIRIAMRWQERSFGFRRNLQKSAWCLPLSDGSCLCLAEQVVAPKSSLADSMQIEMAGLSMRADQILMAPSSGSQETSAYPVSRFSTTESLPSETLRWPVDQIANKLPEEVCDVILAHADPKSIVAIDSARLKANAAGWEIDEMVVLDQDLHGLPVVSALTSQVIGFVSISKQSRMIVNN